MHENNSAADALALYERDLLTSSADRLLVHLQTSQWVDCHALMKSTHMPRHQAVPRARDDLERFRSHISPGVWGRGTTGSRPGASPTP